MCFSVIGMMLDSLQIQIPCLCQVAIFEAIQGVVFVCHNSGFADVLFNSPVILTAIASLSHQAGCQNCCFSRQAGATGLYIAIEADACIKAADSCAGTVSSLRPPTTGNHAAVKGSFLIQGAGRTERGNTAAQKQPYKAGTREISCPSCLPWRGKVSGQCVVSSCQ